VISSAKLGISKLSAYH